MLVIILLTVTVALSLLASVLALANQRQQRQHHEHLLTLQQQLQCYQQQQGQQAQSQTQIWQQFNTEFSARHEQWRAQNLQQWQQLQTQLHTQAQTNLEQLLTRLQANTQDLREQVLAILQQNTHHMTQHLQQLTQTTDKQLTRISQQVEQRLQSGFEKTTATFTDIVKRLTIIDEAQKRIAELSTQVVDLQLVLNDKRSRGAFGEVQLSSLIGNMLPNNHYALQYSLSNRTRVDCLLFLPPPTGNIAVDAKFPLEGYRALCNATTEAEKKQASQQLRQDVRRHIQAIADKYIISGETAEGAVMFIPAEAVFAEIHAHFPDLIELAQQAKVWLVSPTTMMAVLTTIRAVIKDDATKQQVHIIQAHLKKLSGNFKRFKTRMDNLAKHIGKANDDVKDIHTSASKMTKQFEQIERVELEALADDSDAAIDATLESM